jgi:hypothetical protein
LKINQDGEFFCRIILQSKELKFCNTCFVYYRISNSNSITSSFHSYEKIKSKLDSYNLYVKHLSPLFPNKKLERALAINYSHLFLRYYPNSKDILELAQKQSKELGFKRMPPAGSKLFKIVATFLGQRNTTFLRHTLIGPYK